MRGSPCAIQSIISRGFQCALSREAAQARSPGIQRYLVTRGFLGSLREVFFFWFISDVCWSIFLRADLRMKSVNRIDAVVISKTRVRK